MEIYVEAINVAVKEPGEQSPFVHRQRNQRRTKTFKAMREGANITTKQLRN